MSSKLSLTLTALFDSTKRKKIAIRNNGRDTLVKAVLQITEIRELFTLHIFIRNSFLGTEMSEACQLWSSKNELLLDILLSFNYSAQYLD